MARKRITVNTENPNGIEVDLTAEEITAVEARQAEATQTLADERAVEAEAKSANDALKSSAKAKLMAGEALTEAEADTIVL
tara:strand:- start:123 stop:365 length:243 start_codon:yes stop_codon:yes gene_type:complete